MQLELFKLTEPGVYLFHGMDQKELYERHLKTKPTDWIWRDKPVRYTLNNPCGYRCPEWNTINWSTSIVLLGCSHMFGTGLDDSETMASLLGPNIVNLSITGASPQWIWATIVKLLTQKVTPRGFIICWPHHSRNFVFDDNDPVVIKNIGNWLEDEPYKTHHKNFNWSKNAEYKCILYRESIRLMIDPSSLIECSLSTDTAKLLEVPILIPDNSNFQYIDLARDDVHAGPKIQKIWAGRMLKWLKLKKLI